MSLSSEYSIISTSKLVIKDKLGLGGKDPIEIQDIDYEIPQVIKVLENYGISKYAYFNNLVAGPLLGSGSSSRFGIVTTISGDGNTIVTGSLNSFIWTFRKINDDWKQLGEPMSLSFVNGLDTTSLKLTHDGSILYSGANSSVNVYLLSGNQWTLDSSIIPFGSVSKFGNSISLSSDEKVMAIGDPYNNSFIGATWIFTHVNGIWTETAKLVGTSNSSFRQGFCVSLSADGKTVAIGGPKTIGVGNTGALWVFEETNGTWTETGSQLAGTGQDRSTFGLSVCISGNGSSIIVGGPYNSKDAIDVYEFEGYGAIWIYTKISNIWVQTFGPFIPDNISGQTPQFGNSCHINYDGSVFSASAWYNFSGIGSVYFYKKNGNSWERISMLTPYKNTTFAHFGGSTSIDKEFKTIVVGSWGYLNDRGSLFIYNSE